MMPEDAPPPGTECIVTDCEQPATLFVRLGETANLEEPSSVAMCDEHAAHWHDGDLN